MRIIFSGGGTGGHIFPAIAVANEVKKRIEGSEILFVGAKGKMEMEKIPKAGYSVKGLWISGFQRRLTLTNILFPIKLLHSLFSAFFIVRSFRPDAVAGFGGFASGPALFVASRLGIPTLLQEQNSFPGITNRLLGKKADVVCVGYENAQKYFKQTLVKFTGNPVRNLNVKKTSREFALKHFGLTAERKTVFILGGSLGAKSLNEAMRKGFGALRDEEKIQFIWQCGAGYYEDYRFCNTANLANVTIWPFIDKMELAYRAADMVVSRAGALSVTELCVQGKATILVPSPNVAEDHQTKNALDLLEKEACLMLDDRGLERTLIPLLAKTLNDKQLLQKLEKNILILARPDATERITDALLGLAKMKKND